MRILFTLSQRPELTGSGVTLDALVREAARAGHEPWVLCGLPAGDPTPSVGGLPPERVRSVTFGPGGDLPFPVPGMSDVMPYASTVWSAMTPGQVARYRDVWRGRLAAAMDDARPDLIHCNHLWLVSALAAEVLAGRGAVPSVAHCHATGLRQMALCPRLGAEAAAGLRMHGAFLVPQIDLARQVTAALDVPRERIVAVGAGYREDLFHARGVAGGDERRGHLLYVGKFAAAKGLPWLLDTCESLGNAGERFTLHVAGDGAGDEAEKMRARMAGLANVVMHGRLDQADLGGLMRRCATLVLPSLYEGLPLVLAEARACGCRLVSTALPGVVTGLVPALGRDLRLVDPPRLVGPDTPVREDLPGFTDRLTVALREALAAGPAGPPSPGSLDAFTWRAVLRRVEAVWLGLRP